MSSQGCNCIDKREEGLLLTAGVYRKTLFVERLSCVNCPASQALRERLSVFIQTNLQLVNSNSSWLSHLESCRQQIFISITIITA